MKRILTPLSKLSPKKRYALFGVFLGLLFPLGGTIMEIALGHHDLPFSISSFLQVQLLTPMLWIIDLAPLLLGIVFSMVGASEEKLAQSNDFLEQKIAERTAELEKSNLALKNENDERQRAEQEALRQKQYFQALIENSPTAVVMLDNDEKILDCNSAFEELYGYTCAEIVGEDIDVLITTQETKAEAAALTQQVMTERVHRITKRRRKDGSLVDVELFGVPVFVEGERAGALAIYHDISVLIRAKLMAEEANRAKSEFLANMSHEIRTPMNGVIGMLDLVLDTPLDDEQRDYVAVALQSAEALLTLLNDILDYSKIEAKKLELEIIDFNLRNTVEGVAYTLAKRAEEKELELASLVHPDVPTNLCGDPGRLRQVLVNLTGNAIKFTQAGEVIIRAEPLSETDTHVTIRFSVQDTGIGIPADRVDAIFERFIQADGSTTRRFGGTGLGLAISRQLVEAMGGELKVESEPGKGSTFSFVIQFEKSSRKAPEAPPEITSLQGLHILVVDDNAANRTILTKMLESFGCRAKAVPGGPEALDELSTARHAGNPYQIMLLDMQMPGMDGEQTARAIFSDPREKNLSIVILTSMGKRGDAKRLEALGCAGYLLKPIKQQLLFDALVVIINEKQNASRGTGRLITRHLVAERKRKGECILLAEDNLVNQKVAVAMLQKAGHSVDVVENGLQALKKIQEKPYSLVLMDVQMPEMDGFEATRRIRKWEADKRRTPIIAMTAHTMKGDRERCLEAGMDDYISKPLDRQVLFNAIERWAQPIGVTGKLSKLERREKEDHSVAPDALPLTQNGPAFGESAQPDRFPAPEAKRGAAPPPADSRPSGIPPLDIEAALPRFSNDRDFFNEMSREFLKNLPARIQEMTDALETVDSASLNRAAHNLKGMSANFSASTLTALAKKLERQSREGDLSEAASIIRQIEAEAARLEKYLAELDVRP